MNDDQIQVTYTAYMLPTRIPFRYQVRLYVEDLFTGVSTTVWGRTRAEGAMEHMVHHGNEILQHYGLAAELAATIYSRRREERMAQVKVGDKVRLLVDIGQFKKGRVCNVVEVAEPTDYVSRGEHGWADEKYPIKVLPISTAYDKITLGPKDSIPLAMGEFGPIDQEVE